MSRSLPRVLTALALLLLAAVGAALAFSHPRYQFGTLVGDDAGYYLAVARNAMLGHGFSFDRIHPTNGFNPLMPMLLIPLDRVLSPDGDLVRCFRIATLASWAVVLIGLWPLRVLARRVLAAYGVPSAAQPLAVAALSLLYAGFLALKGYYGMDAFLVLTLGLAWLARVASRGVLARGLGAGLLDGALLAATVLARVDSLPLAAAGFLLMLLRTRGLAEAWGALLLRLCTFVALVAPYLWWNRSGFGDWLPISARLKSSFPVLDPAASLHVVRHSSLNAADQAGLAAALTLAVAWLLATLIGRVRERADGDSARAKDAMLVWALYLAGRLGWLLLFSRLDVQGSYFVLAHPFTALALLVAASRLAGARGAQAAGVAVALVAVALTAGKLSRLAPDVRAIAGGVGDEWNLGRRIHDAVGERDVIFGGALGLVGYVADRAWINGDGVANERAYQDAIAAGRLAEYLRLSGVTHVVVTASPPRPAERAPFRMEVGSVLHGATDSLELDPSGLVLEERMRRSGGTSLWLYRWPAPPPPAPPSDSSATPAATPAVANS